MCRSKKEGNVQEIEGRKCTGNRRKEMCRSKKEGNVQE